MRDYIGHRHVAQPKPPAQTRASRFFWRGWRWGVASGAVALLIVEVLIALGLR